MSAYVIGNVLGRLVISYIIAYVLILLLNRFNFQKALKGSVRWYGWILTATIFLLGMIGSLNGGVGP